MHKPKAVALLSGGLDSSLAVLAVLRQNIDVTAITFLTYFGCDISDHSSCSKNPYPAAEKFGFMVKLSPLGEKFVEIVKNPQYGHGRNMNPCIDCRILMLSEAKVFMEMSGADFIVTGEVLGQRPMSQMRNTLRKIDKEAGLEGYVLRPLSARLLEETIPEQQGMVDRQLLYGFHGRTRKPQIALAREFGLNDYPAPAGGCLLTEPNYSNRLRDLLQHVPHPSMQDLMLLRLGRHFRLSPSCKAVVGRNERENETLLSFASDAYLLHVEHAGSPVVVLIGSCAEEYLPLAASFCARYSDAKLFPRVEVTVSRAGESITVSVAPASDAVLGQYRIEKPLRERRGIRLSGQ